MGDLLGNFFVVGVVVLTLAIGFIFRATKGPGRRPLSPIVRLRYRGRARGTVVGVVESSVRVGYSVGGRDYFIEQKLAREERGYYADESYSWSLGDFVPTDWRRYETTTLGDLWMGGPIDVRYRPDDPADAVLVPNPHGPYMR